MSGVHHYLDQVSSDLVQSAGRRDNLSFDQLKTLFFHQLASSRRQMRSTQTLFGVRQKDNEPLRAFLKRFTMAKLEYPDASEDLAMSAFIQGLKEGELHAS